MKVRVGTYREQKNRWPTEGRHILAQYDNESIVVYQAYRDSIADYAIKHNQFGGDFSYNRMSWIKPNFLWMMFRSGWAEKEGQQRILAVHLRRSGFDEILRRAVASSFNASQHQDETEWQSEVKRSEVRLQWDPDHSPAGGKLTRRAIQLGLRGHTLREYGTSWIVEIEDVTDFVVSQRELRTKRDELLTPLEEVYHVEDQSVRERLGLD